MAKLSWALTLVLVFLCYVMVMLLRETRHFDQARRDAKDPVGFRFAGDPDKSLYISYRPQFNEHLVHILNKTAYDLRRPDATASRSASASTTD